MHMASALDQAWAILTPSKGESDESESIQLRIKKLHMVKSIWLRFPHSPSFTGTIKNNL